MQPNKNDYRRYKSNIFIRRRAQYYHYSSYFIIIYLCRFSEPLKNHWMLRNLKAIGFNIRHTQIELLEETDEAKKFVG